MIADERTLDELFEGMFRDHTPEELEALKRKYATEDDVLEAENLIAAKARDMLRHYVEAVLPKGHKAQVVATSHRAAVRYQKALVGAHQTLLTDLEAIDPPLLTLSEEELERSDPETRFLIRAHPQLESIRRLEFAAVISGDRNDPPGWAQWTADARRDEHVARFKKPLVHEDPAKSDGLAFLCVKSMLLTGFDAPVEGVLYLDRKMRGHELLQAIARVNRTHPEKQAGLVVDYYGVTRHLEEALEDYRAEDVGGARNALWRQLKADVSGKLVHVVSEPECVARGAAMLAGISADIFEDYNSVPSPEHEPYTHKPTGDSATYKRLYSEAHRPLRERLGSLCSIQ